MLSTIIAITVYCLVLFVTKSLWNQYKNRHPETTDTFVDWCILIGIALVAIVLIIPTARIFTLPSPFTVVLLALTILIFTYLVSFFRPIEHRPVLIFGAAQSCLLAFILSFAILSSRL